MQIRDDDLSSEKVRALLAYHQEHMLENSPPGMAYVLNVWGLKAPGVSFWSAWDGDELLGCGAMKELAPDWGEIKSMRAHPDHLRKGVGAEMLEHIISVAKARSYRRLSLETGAGPTFEAALRLYRKRGFENGAVFGDYSESDFNQFLHLGLQTEMT
jgi:putative acetyltransferase